MVVSAIIPVAGKGKRFRDSVLKQYQQIEDQPVIAITVRLFLELAEIDYGVLVVAKNEMEFTSHLLSPIERFNHIFKIVAGGTERQDSVYNGLQNVPSDTDIVVVHDGVRPLVSKKSIIESIRIADKYGAAVVAAPVKETIKRVEQDLVIETLPRQNLWQIQTPQSFKYDILKDAHEKARAENYYSTDEAALVERYGYQVKIIRGDYSNIKITTEEDLSMVRALYQKRNQS